MSETDKQPGRAEQLSEAIDAYGTRRADLRSLYIARQQALEAGCSLGDARQRHLARSLSADIKSTTHQMRDYERAIWILAGLGDEYEAPEDDE